MDIFVEYMLEAKKRLKMADYMLTQTYPLVNDSKLLLGVLNNIFLSVQYGISALLHFERIFKRVPPFGDSFESQLNIFQKHCVERYSFDADLQRFIFHIKKLIQAHKESPVEFSKKDKFIICDENYNIETFTVEEIKEFLKISKIFHTDLLKIIDMPVDI